MKQRCPYCGDRAPKEMIDVGKKSGKVDPLILVLSGLFTCGVGSLIYWAIVAGQGGYRLEAYCEKCGETFTPDRV